MLLRSFRPTSHLRRFTSPRQSSTAAELNPATLQLLQGLKEGQRHALSRAITLAESTRADHRQQAELLIDQLGAFRRAHPHRFRPYQGSHTLRIGVAGPPGAGKSTFIEALGTRLVDQGHKVAVVAIDPSSMKSGGSILGDVTRMEQLTKSPNAYVRGSPTRGVLGGVGEHTNDVVLLCEGAGYDCVIVESVGLGQSEVSIDQAVDLLILLVPPAGGDDLQGQKKGIMEVADMVVINKADGELLNTAQHTKADYSAAMKFRRRKYEEWGPPVLLASARTGNGMEKVIETMNNFHSVMFENGVIPHKRVTQARHWMWQSVKDQLWARLSSDPAVKERAAQFEADLEKGTVSPRMAARDLLGIFLKESTTA